MDARRQQKDRKSEAARTAEMRRLARRTYSSPRLEPFGDIRGLTLGGSPGIGDSGGSLITKPN